KCGYERLANETRTQDDELVVLSPAFVSSEHGQQLLRSGDLKPAGSVTIPYQAAGDGHHFTGPGQPVEHRTFKFANAETMRAIDACLAYVRGSETLNGLQRVCMHSHSCKRDVWIHIAYE